MNLVQIQERLKDVPTQAIMQYANGGNPMVPPYLALAELKRRETVNQSAQAQQAMQQGRQPSVKDQIEQAAGLAALQKQMQQQGMQGLLAQARPQGIPENIPQPQRQPESEGIAGLPAGDFNFADGGIVAFAKGGTSGMYPEESPAMTGDEGLIPIEQLQAEYMRLLRNQQFSSARKLAEKIKARQEVEARTVVTPVATMGEDVQPLQPQASAQPQAVAQPPGTPPATRIPGQLPPPGGIAGQIALPAGRTMEQRLPMGTPEVMSEGYSAAKDMPERALLGQPQGIAAIQGAEQSQKMILEAMRKQSTPEEIYQAQQKMAGLYGLTQPYGEERVKRAKEMEAARQQDLESRGMERLMRVMGGIAGRGLQGAAPAYLSAIEGERASDLAFRKQMDELLGGVEEKRRAEQMAGLKRDIEQMGEERKLGLGAAEKIFDAQRRREEEELKQRWEVQKSRMMPNEAQMKQKLIDDIMRRNPNMSFAEAYGKAMELSQGLTPEIKREQLRAKAYNEAAKMWEDMPLKPKDITREQWIEREVNNRLRTQASAEVPDDIGQLLKKYGGK